MSRRNAVKLGAFTSAAMLLPFARRAFTGTPATRLVDGGFTSKSLFTVQFGAPPVAKPYKTVNLPFNYMDHKGTYQQIEGVSHDVYKITQRMESVEILPGRKTKIFGYDGVTPGPSIVAESWNPEKGSGHGKPYVVQQIIGLPQSNAELPGYGGYPALTSPARHRLAA